MNKTPKLRFKEFSGDWESKKLGDLTTLIQSGLSRQLSDKDIGVPVIRSNNLINGKIDTSDIKYWYNIDTQGARLENYFLKKNDLLVNFINSLAQIGKCSLYNDELNRNTIFTTNIMRLNFYGNVDTNYIHNYFKLKKYSDYIQSIAKPAVNQASFTVVDFKRFKINIPSLEEQEKIASFFSLIDKKISLQSEKVEMLKEYKKGMMQKIFSRELRFKDDSGRDYPEWEEKKIEDIATLTSSKRIFANDYVAEGIPFYRGKEITELKQNKKPQNILYISEEKYSDIKDKFGIPTRGDLLLTAVGTLGNSYIINDDKPFYFKDGNLIWFKDIKEDVNFLDIILSNEKGKKKVIDSAIGSTQKALTIVELNKLKFKFPSLDEQLKISRLFYNIDLKVLKEEEKLNSLNEYKKGLLQQMFV